MATPAYSTVPGYGNVLPLSDGSVKDLPTSQLLGLILIELRMMNEILIQGLNVEDETSSFRADAALAAPTTLTTPT